MPPPRPSGSTLITPDLKNSQVVAFPFTGHAVLGKSTCALSIMTGLPRQPDEAGRPDLRRANHADIHDGLTVTASRTSALPRDEARSCCRPGPSRTSSPRIIAAGPPKTHPLRRDDLDKAIRFLKNVVQATERALGRATSLVATLDRSVPGATTRVEVVAFHNHSLDHYFRTASRARSEHVQDQRLSLGGDAHCEWQAIRGAILPLRNPSPCDHPISYLTRHRVPVIGPRAIAIKTKKRLSGIAVVH